MSTLDVKLSTQYVIKELRIHSNKGNYDVRGLLTELNIFDSIFNPCMSGSLLLHDGMGLSSKLGFDGTQMLSMDISKDDSNLRIKKTFRIYKQSHRKQYTLNSEMYVLHFISDEFMFSKQTLINQTFTGTYSEAAVMIMDGYLGITKYGTVDDSYGIKNISLPNKKPIETLEWCAMRALDYYDMPNFLFFENRLGYNFVSLSRLKSESEIAKINMDPKNIKGSPGISNEFLGARDMKVIKQFDVIKNTENGVYAGQTLGFSPTTRTVNNQNYSYIDITGSLPQQNKTPNIGLAKNIGGEYSTSMYKSKQSLYPTSQWNSVSEYIKKNDPDAITKADDMNKYLFQRRSIFQASMGQRVQVVLPGNFDITSGANVMLAIPKRSELAKGSDIKDATLYGKYLVIATRHIIKYDKHETIFECATDSSNESTINTSSEEQIGT